MKPILWLASRSPRRRQLLESAGWSVRCEPADVDERVPPDAEPVDFAMQLAFRKGQRAPLHEWVVAADTVVHSDGEIFDKPNSREQALHHIHRLSGRWHQVTTAVFVRRPSHQAWFATHTDVRFRTLSTPEIEAYVATGEADDKAGAYGIQGLGGFLVAEIRGSWTNVMGLPLEETLAALNEQR